MAKSSMLLWGGIAVGGYLAYRAYQKAMAVRNLFYSIKKVRFLGTDLSKTGFEIELGVSNLSNESLAYNRFFGQIRYNGNILVTISNDGQGRGIVIKPMAETSITIPVYIYHLQVGLALKDIIESFVNKTNVEGLQVQGTLYAGGVSVPLTQTISLNFNNTSQQVKGIGCPGTAVGGVLN